MLSDRDYMRDGSRRPPLTMTARLTIVMGVVFALQCINDVYLRQPLDGYLALTGTGLQKGWLWQLLSYQFLHASLLHVLFNLICFWWLGHFAENVLRRGRFLLLLFGSGALGGVVQGALMIAWPRHYGPMAVGASAGVSGLLALFALLERDTEIRFQFVLPMRAIYLLYLEAGVSLFFTLVPTARELGIAHAAHLGGILGGVAFVKLGWHRDYQPLPWETWWEGWQSRRRRTRPARRAWSAEPVVRPPVEEEIPSAEFISKQVDPILDKIAAHGMQSLTDREKKILEAARAKMAKR